MSSEILKKINTWYVETAKGARWMDLIGDYAGDELFVVDGESLLQLVLDDPFLDIGRGNGCGFQIIHAVYLLESFLSKLLTRNANIEIVFFHSTLYATTRPGATFFTYSSRVLARQLLLKHLERLSVPMYHFNSLKDPAWVEHEAEYKPMFVLIADAVKSPSVADTSTDYYLGSHRGLIFDIISYGLPVALLNGLEFRDSKVLTFVLERQAAATSAWSVKPIIAKLSDLVVARPGPSVPLIQQNLSGRTELLVAICRAFIQSPGGSSPVQRALLYVFLLHVFVLDALSLKDRIQTPPQFSSIAKSTLRDEFYPTLFLVTADLISNDLSASLDVDMTIFCALLAYLRAGVAIEEAVCRSVLSKVSHVWVSSGAGVVPNRKQLFDALEIFEPRAGEPRGSVEDPSNTALLPFSHPVFDDVLSSVDVATTAADIDPTMPYLDFSHVFTDSQHWHNQNKLITLGETGSKKLSFWALRSHQRYMRSLHRQAETLTGALGQGLRQITIATVATRKEKSSEKKKSTPQQHANKKSKPKPLTKVERMKLEIAEAKAHEQDNSSRLWFQKYLKDHKDDDISTKLASFDGLRRSSRFAEPWLSVEGLIYEMHLKICAWLDHPERDSAPTRDDFTVSIMRIISKIADSCPLSLERAAVVSDVLTVLGFTEYIPQIVSVAQQTSPSPLAFKFVKVLKSSRPLYAWMRITEHSIRWQLRLFGPYMDRSMDGAFDARVDFKPDGWQRKALDCIDDPKHSVLVVAPTSAGKTFVSFYAMEKVLRDSDDGILVYIAPTKALVNQIVAEIYARFSKKLDKGTLWAIHTRDYRVNDPQNCQILVTVPEVLAIMLLSPPLASKWTPRMKRIILDEIHTIGQQDGGAVWEQILLLAPCPFIGLSATVGSPHRFNDWLASLAEAHGWNHSFIQHKHRYSHLRKFYYRLNNLKTIPVFRGLQASKTTDRLRFLHPISMLSFQVGRKTLPDDLALEPADTLSLFDVIAKQRAAAPELIARLDPVTFFGPEGCRLLKQSDILRYEHELKQLLSMDTMNDATASLDVDEIVDDLTDNDVLQADPKSKDIKAGFLPLAVDLHNRQLLPAIFFNFDRSACEAIAHNLLRRLVEAETAWKNESPAWNRKVSQWQAWKNSEKTRKREEDRATRARKKDPDDQPDDGNEKRTWESNFDPDAPLPDFSFAGLYSNSELDEQIKEELWRFDKTSWLIQALRRGIAVHHAGMNKRYRSLIENLFRRGIVRIMISTGTLALGINAPAKTSVFCGDSPFLTALIYRQCAGRAGRRGYDLLGNVIFYGLPIDRVQRLVLSKLPSLGGTFPLTATLTLRLLNLLHGSDNAPYAVNAIRNIMQLPQISFGSSMGRSQLQQHLRFNIEYLRRARLIDQSGAPINLSAICAHLYYTEPSNFALVNLLHRGILHCISEEVEPEREFICLMSHLFGRRYLPSALSGSEELILLKQTFPSMIELPPLREDARGLLVKHDEEVRRIFRNYVMTYVVQYADELGSDHTLPLSGTQYPGSSTDTSSFVAHLRKTAHCPLVRSHFVANSGYGDTFESIEELTRTARSGVHLSEYAIPNMRPYTTQGEGEHTLNAYLLDFYIHGQDKTLAVANGIRKGELWFLLQDFMLTLLTVKASLEQYLTRIALGSSEESEDVMAVGADLAEMDNDSEDGDGFSRPEGVSDEDWRVYVVVKNATAQFDEKYRKIWA